MAETKERGECDYLKITNVLPSMKKDLKHIAKEELTTMTPMVKRILRKAIEHWKLTGNIAA